MILVKPSTEFLNMSGSPLEVIERAGRTCYKSEEKITPDSADEFVHTLIRRGHLAMIEHAWMRYRIICDRGVTHEIVRHRLFSYAQESTRYCDYSGGVTFVLPCWMSFRNPAQLTTGDILTNQDVQHYFSYMPFDPEHTWLLQLLSDENCYQLLLKGGWKPQEARGVLPNALKTEIVVTGNLREWRHFFTLRTARAAHPQMREVADAVLADARSRVAVVFEGLTTDDDNGE